jgi:hypothetical protein
LAGRSIATPVPALKDILAPRRIPLGTKDEIAEEIFAGDFQPSTAVK